MRGAEDDTVVFMKIVEPMTVEEPNYPPIVKDALDLVVDLWPTTDKPTTLEAGPQWDKLRAILLAVPDLWMETRYVNR